MDLSSLPMEMIASILKHFDHLQLVNLRKKSALVDTVVQLYGSLKRLPVRDCWFDVNDKEAAITLNLEEQIGFGRNLDPTEDWGPDYNFYDFQYSFIATDWLHLLPIFDKIQVDAFTFEFFTICNETQQALQTNANAFKKCCSIEINNVHIDCSKNEFMKFLDIFPKADILKTMCLSNSEYILNFEFLSSRKWKEIEVFNKHPVAYDKLEDAALDLIVANGTTLKLKGCQPHFLVKGIAKALEAISVQGNRMSPSSWGILDISDMKTDEVMELFRAIPGINIEWNSDTHEVKVKFDRDPRMAVEFIMGKLAD